jgi:hypothetical protein
VADTNTTSPVGSESVVRPSKTLNLIAAGYVVAAAGLVAFLTINGISVPGAATAITILLIALGLLLPPAGMFAFRGVLGRNKTAARNGLLLEGSGLIVLLLGVVLAVSLSSLTGYLVGAIFVAGSGASALLGAVMLRRKHSDIGLGGPHELNWLVLGTVLIFSGAAIIMTSNIAFFYFISQVQNTVYVDIGATVIALGCVLGAYSFFLASRPSGPHL